VGPSEIPASSGIDGVTHKAELLAMGAGQAHNAYLGVAIRSRAPPKAGNERAKWQRRQADE